MYVSYDGMGEPLGRSQVLTYLLRLAEDFAISLISFEKPDSPIDDLRGELAAAGIDWHPLSYHRRPPVLSTLLDVTAGVWAVRSIARSARPDIVHVRSYVPALIAVLAERFTGGRLLFAIRGFWADERVEGAIWAEGGVLYRVAKRCERRFFTQADAVVTLTEASVPQIRAWLGGREVPVVVIPTCVDLDRFTGRPPRQGGPHAVWSGSIGTWYRFDLVPAVVRALKLPLTVVTRQRELARAQLGDLAANVVTRTPQEMPLELHAGDVGLCLIKTSFSKVASAPTRLAEFLAAGMPVIGTPVGDMERLIEDNGVGVILRSEDEAALGEAAVRVLRMAADPAVRDRCRRLARHRFDAAAGSASYARLYGELLAPSPARSS
jgi:glycosyltransferase involved in cell wall biosynthesis